MPGDVIDDDLAELSDDDLHSAAQELVELFDTAAETARRHPSPGAVERLGGLVDLAEVLAAELEAREPAGPAGYVVHRDQSRQAASPWSADQ